MNFVFSLRPAAAAADALPGGPVPVTRVTGPRRRLAGCNVSRPTSAGVNDPAAGSHSSLVGGWTVCWKREPSVDLEWTAACRGDDVFDVGTAPSGRRLVAVDSPQVGARTSESVRVSGGVKSARRNSLINGYIRWKATGKGVVTRVTLTTPSATNCPALIASCGIPAITFTLVSNTAATLQNRQDSYTSQNFGGSFTYLAGGGFSEQDCTYGTLFRATFHLDRCIASTFGPEMQHSPNLEYFGIPYHPFTDKNYRLSIRHGGPSRQC